MDITTVLENIKTIRKDKGISTEYLADSLSISQGAYSNIENNISKLTVQRLLEISKVLEVGIPDIFGLDMVKYNQSFSNNKINNSIGHQEVDKLYNNSMDLFEETKKIYENVILEKNKTIEHLMNFIEKTNI